MSSKNGRDETYSPGNISMDLAVQQTSPAQTEEKVMHPAPNAGIVVPILELPTVNLENLSLDELQKKGPVIKEQAQRVRDWVTSFLPTLEKFQSLDREVKEMYESKIEEAKLTLNRLLHEENTKPYRRAAWLAYLQYMLSKKLSKDDAIGLAEKLVKDGFFKPTGNGPIVVGYARKYDIPPEAYFGPEEIGVIQKAAQAMTARAEALLDQKHKEKIRSLREQGVNTSLELANGKTGVCSMNVPPEQIDEEHWRPGGTILVELVEENGEKRIYPLEAVGTLNFEAAMKEAIDLCAYVPVASLSDSRPPHIRGLDGETQRKVSFLWFILQRGINAAKKEAEFTTMKEEYRCKVAESFDAVSAEEFVLELKPGICVVEFEGVREVIASGGKKLRFYNVFFIGQIVAGEEGLPSTFMVVKVPPHLSDFIGGFVGKPYGATDNKFEGLPPKLGDLMRAVRGQLARKKRITDATSQEKEAAAVA